MSTTTTKPKITFRKHKEIPEAIFHPDTNVVFRSSLDKTAIGRWIDGELVAIDQNGIDFCEKNKFKIDPSCLENGETEEDDAEGSAEEEPVNNEDSEQTLTNVNPVVTEQVQVETNEQVQDETNEQVPESTELVAESSNLEMNDEDFQKENDNFSQILNNLLVHRQNSTQRYELKIKNLSCELTNMKNVLDDTTKQLQQTAEDFKKLQTKFDMMKSLFS